jgi:ATP-binding cassette subfamily B protein
MKSNSFLLVWNTLEGNKKWFVFAIILMGFSAFFAYVPPIIIKATVDSVLGEDPFTNHRVIGPIFATIGRTRLRQQLWIPGVFLFGSALIQGTLVFLSGFFAAQSSELASNQLKDKLYNHLLSLPTGYHAGAEKGDLLQRCTSDVDTVRKFLALQLVQVGNGGFLVLASLLVTFSIHVPLALIALPIIPLAITSSIIFFGKIQASFKISDEAEASLTTLVQEHLTGIRVVRAFGRQKQGYQKFVTANTHYRTVTMKLIFWFSLFWSTSDIMSLLQVVTVIGVGTLWAVQGSITLGTLLLFISSVWMILWPVRLMGRVLVDMGKAFVAIQRIDEILKQPKEPMNHIGHRHGITGEIEFENVSFSYDGKNNALEDISFSIPKGTTIGILGPTGSGKSTLAALLTSLYEPTEGRILLDGIDHREYAKDYIRSRVALVLQEPYLFARNIHQNIALPLGNQGFRAQVESVAKDACIHDTIMNFDLAYETPVGERGVTLSGGQKQRVAIARALITDAPIMIFDDSLSALDTETDQQVQLAIKKNGVGKTVILISHRLSTLSHADTILVLKDGRLIQQGTIQELVQKEGMFQRLWKLQTDLYEQQ